MFFLLEGFEEDNSRLAIIVVHGAVELKEIITQTPTPTPIIFSPTPSPIISPTPTVTPTPTPIPNRVWVTNNESREEDLSNGTDIDLASDKSLTVRWMLNTMEVISFHIYVIENDQPCRFLQAVSPNENLWTWTDADFNNFYIFEVFAVQDEHNAQSPRFEEPFVNEGPVQYLEFTG